MAKVLEPHELSQIRKILKRSNAFLLSSVTREESLEDGTFTASWKGEHKELVVLLLDLLMRSEIKPVVVEALTFFAMHNNCAFLTQEQIIELQKGGASTTGQLIGVDGKPITFVKVDPNEN